MKLRRPSLWNSKWTAPCYRPVCRITLKEFFKQPKGSSMEMPGCLAIGAPTDELQPVKVTFNTALATRYLEFSIEQADVIRAAFLTKSEIGSLLSGTKFYHKLHPKQQ